MSNKNTILYLIRHAATPSNEYEPYIIQGSGIDQSLSEKGTQQANALGKFFQQIKLDSIYSSPLKRAYETACAVREYQESPCEYAALDLLMEVNVGDWEGLTWSDIELKFPQEYQNFIKNPWATPYLNGESYQQVFERVQPVFRELLTKHQGQVIAVIGHNVINRAWLSQILEFDLQKIREIPQSNTGVNVLEAGSDGISLLTLNATFHLGYLPKSTDIEEYI